MIDQLPLLTPNPRRAARVVATCHRKLTPRPRRRPIEPALVAGFCLIYLSAVLLTALDFVATR